MIEEFKPEKRWTKEDFVKQFAGKNAFDAFFELIEHLERRIETVSKRMVRRRFLERQIE